MERRGVHIGLPSFRTKHYSIDPIFIGRTHSPKGTFLARHYHHFNEFHQILDGELVIRIGKEPVTVTAGMAFHIAPGISHTQFFKKSGVVCYFGFSHAIWHTMEQRARPGVLFKNHADLDPSVFSTSGAFALDRTTSLYLPTFITAAEPVFLPDAQTCDLLWQLLRKIGSTLKRIQRERIQLIETSRRNIACSATVSSALYRAIVFARDHFHEPIGVDDLARAACMSRRHFSRQFHSSVGITPKQYLSDLRFQRALELLADPTIKIEQIGEHIGFLKPTYFFTFFKKYTNQTPFQYREQHHKDLPKG